MSKLKVDSVEVVPKVDGVDTGNGILFYEGDVRKLQIDCSQDGVTQQHFKDECDINTIVERARTSGMAMGNPQEPVYADVSAIPDYRVALDTVLEAQNAFYSLDAVVRDRFSNDPAKLLDFLSKEENYDEGVKLGLFKPKLVPVEPSNEASKEVG